jgi:hypothetical protein
MSDQPVCERFVHTDEPDMDWVCVCGHDTDWHNYGPSKPGGPCEACADLHRTGDTMSDPIERQITINRTDQGHGPVSACVNDAPGLMPIRLESNGYEIWLRWSEWDEIRDHVEHSAMIARPENLDNEYEVCNAGPGLVPYDAMPCILERGHSEDLGGSAHHSDRLGRRW